MRGGGRGWRKPAQHCLTLVVALVLGWYTPAGGVDPLQKAVVISPPEVGVGARLPVILGHSDQVRYRAIFGLQELARWQAADREIRLLDDCRLMGHVLAQRYLHRSYLRASYAELRLWLERYADHPYAQEIHRLAIKRKPPGAAAPPKPSAEGARWPATIGRFAPAGAAGEYARSAGWRRGLAAWRARGLELARREFETLATAPGASEWTRAAGAYWAARANLVLRRPAAVAPWLKLAAGSPRTFYGALARRALGMDSGLDLDAPLLLGADSARLSNVPAWQRALALIEVGERGRAEREFRATPPAETDERRLILALALEEGLPALALDLANTLERERGELYEGAYYPLPPWTPPGGFSVDRALVYALMRQESQFRVGALSPAGARGLMQLMPATASFITNDRSLLRARRDRLFDPELNLAIGQEYLVYLGTHEAVGGDLVRLIAAYNGGPGNLAKWVAAIGNSEDPLLLIEGIPVEETRLFVQRVLFDLWAYRTRLGERAHSLDALAAGESPLYTSAMGSPAADHVRN